MKRWHVRLYFRGSGDVDKMDCVVEASAPTDLAAIDVAKKHAEEQPLFRDMTFVKATAKQVYAKRGKP